MGRDKQNKNNNSPTHCHSLGWDVYVESFNVESKSAIMSTKSNKGIIVEWQKGY